MMMMFLLGTAYAISSLPQIFVENIKQLQHDHRKNLALAKTHDRQLSLTTKLHQFDDEVLDDGTTGHGPKIQPLWHAFQHHPTRNHHKRGQHLVS